MAERPMCQFQFLRKLVKLESWSAILRHAVSRALVLCTFLIAKITLDPLAARQTTGLGDLMCLVCHNILTGESPKED